MPTKNLARSPIRQRMFRWRGAERGPGRARAATLTILALLAVASCSGSVTVTSFCEPGVGEIDFGLDLDADPTKLHGCADSFKQTGDFAFVGFFPRHVTGTVTLEVSENGGPPKGVGGYRFSSPGNFYSGRWHLSDFPEPGSYVITMTLDGQILATGSFVLTD